MTPDVVTPEQAKAQRERVDAQAERIEKILGLGPETIATFGWRVLLTPDQVDALLAIVDTGTCKCRCMEGRDCGGCGHPGCGYTRPTP